MLTHTNFLMLLSTLVILLILAIFFSCAETSLMALNRYRLRHQARLKKRNALLILKLLKRPDRLLGVVLVGSTLANVMGSAIVTIISLHFWGERGVFFATILLTLVFLVFCEAAPKTLAALYPEKVSRIIAFPVYLFRQIFFPLIWFVNLLSNNLLRILGVKIKRTNVDSLTHDELRTVVYETTGKVPQRYQAMLLGILDLNKLTVNDAMVNRRDLKGIDLNYPWPQIYGQLAVLTRDWVPVYRESIDQLLGVLHARDLAAYLLVHKELDQEKLMGLLHQPYFIPEETPLNVQLHNFQDKHQQVAFVVDEYGEILGSLTLDDILEEIVGEFTAGITDIDKMLKRQPDGSYLVDGMMPVREFNRLVQWELPVNGPRTINGLITEHLEALPRKGTGLLIERYPIEIIEVKANRVKLARVFPQHTENKEE
jgi:Mg2+/Co2+ transporter CorB